MGEGQQKKITSYFDKESNKPASPLLPAVPKNDYRQVVERLLEKARISLGIKQESNMEEDQISLTQSHKSYTLQQKKAALALVNYMTLAEISRKLKIPYSSLRDWNTKGVSEDKRKTNSGRLPTIPVVQQKAYEYFQSQRKIGMK
jgi:hypothetical protein